MYNKLGQTCITNWGSFVLLQIRSNVITNWVQLHYHKLGQVLLQIGAAITNQGYRYYKIGQLLQIGPKFITNWSKYDKLSNNGYPNLLQLPQVVTTLASICNKTKLLQFVTQICPNLQYIYIYIYIYIYRLPCNYITSLLAYCRESLRINGYMYYMVMKLMLICFSTFTFFNFYFYFLTFI